MDPLTHTRILRGLARSLAAREADSLADVFTCVAEHLNGSGFGFDRVAVFKDGTGTIETFPVAEHGFPDLEVLHGHLAPVDTWPLFRRALQLQGAVFAPDAQLNGDVPLEVAGALRLRSVVGVPFLANERCLGFAFADRGGGAFDISDDDLELLTTVGELVASVLSPVYALTSSKRESDLKTQFVALASHELRAPIAGIHGVSSTLVKRGDDLRAEQVVALQETLHEQSERMRRLVDQLLDLTKLDAEAIAIDLERFPVRSRVEQVLRDVVPAQQDRVELQIDPGLETIADPAAFDRIVGNLVTNAFRYGAPPVRIAAQQLDTHFRLWVEDRGDGVPAEFAPRLFERFARGKPKQGDGGSGLGLAIAQSFAQAQGGRLLYEDATPHGARFQFVLPVRD
jgi:signal transduction histidine kinase